MKLVLMKMHQKQWFYIYHFFSFFVNSYEEHEISEENSSNNEMVRTLYSLLKLDNYIPYEVMLIKTFKITFQKEYISLSTEDLIHLFNSEKETAKYLSQLQPLSLVVRTFLNQIDYDM